MHHFDTNSIHDVPIKSRRAEDIAKGWQEIYDTLQLNGHVPNIYILDNECLSDLKSTFDGANVEFRLAPPPPPPQL